MIRDQERNVIDKLTLEELIAFDGPGTYIINSCRNVDQIDDLVYGQLYR